MVHSLVPYSHASNPAKRTNDKNMANNQIFVFS